PLAVLPPRPPCSTLFPYTTLLPIFVLVSLFLIAGGAIRDFALVLLIGVIVGTFSSIFVASPVLLEIRERWKPEQPSKGGRSPRKDRKSTRLNSSHVKISYAVFCLKK